MKRLITICAVAVFVMALGNTVQAANWHVPGNFATIQEAIDDGAVLPGDKIIVGPGNHAGAVVTKAVEIKGQAGAVINSGPLLTTYEPCGTIVLNIGFQFGFVGDPPGSGATISQLKFENVAFPVFSRGADDVTVTQCVMEDPIQGVTNWSGSRWEISHNVITDLRSANGGGIGIFVGDSSGGIVSDNVVSHNTISGTLHVAPCDGGGYDGTGIVLFADWRYGRSGALAIEYNRVVKNKVGLTSDNPGVVNVHALELTEHTNPGGIVIHDNAIGFNDFRGTASQIFLSPSGLDNPVNDISRNLGNNRGQGLHPSVFGP
ncbi:MAG: right-handed parallel beta-helix repeat-containing protein [Planctomycetota bacterium]